MAGTRRSSELCNQLYTNVFRRITGIRGLLYQIVWSKGSWCGNGASEEMLRQEESRDIVCPELWGYAGESDSGGVLSNSNKGAWQLCLDLLPKMGSLTESLWWFYSPNSLFPQNHGLLGFPYSPTKIQRKRHFIITGNFVILGSKELKGKRAI